VSYSRPGVKGRTIFGDLVPYGEMWRTGANKATTVAVTTDVIVGGQTLKAGKYSLFTIPGETEWMIIFNKDTELSGTQGYTQRNDAVRLRVTPTEGVFTERFLISIDNITDDGADLILQWATTKVVVPIKVEVAKQTEENVQKALGDAARAYRNAAEYYSKKGDHDKALGYIDQSIAMNSGWYTQWVKAEILAAKGDKKAAKKQGEIAIKAGEDYYLSRSEPFTYKEGLVKEMNAW
jgi:tetratricopeptide (TPR) repeat protein